MPSEDFWVFDLQPKTMTPTWLFNNSLDLGSSTTGHWLHLPVKVLHPALLPDALRDEYTVAFLQTAPAESVVVGGIKSGVFLNRNQLEKIQKHFKCPLPKKGEGHGKKGSLVKRDYVDSVLNYIFPEASDSERKAMFDGLMGGNWTHLRRDKTSQHGPDILRAFQHLDPEDQHEFAGLAQVAMDEEMLWKHRNSQPQRPSGLTYAGKRHETPKSLQDLYPDAPNCRITRHPVLKRYQGFYTVPAGTVIKEGDEPGSFEHQSE